MLTAMQKRSMGLAAAGLLFITGAVPNGQAPASVAARPAFAEPDRADGSEIAFVSGGDIWTVPAAGGEARLLVSHAATETRPVYLAGQDAARVRLDPDRRRRHLRADASRPATSGA